jgi:hypothetical protein
MILLLMPVPETTSAEAFEGYVGGKCLRVGRGKAWREIKVWISALPSVMNVLPLPSVSEPLLVWTLSGEVEFQEREGNQPWVTHRVRKGSFFLTCGGALYDFGWIRSLTAAVRHCPATRYGKSFRARSQQVEQVRVRQPRSGDVDSP